MSLRGSAWSKSATLKWAAKASSRVAARAWESIREDLPLVVMPGGWQRGQLRRGMK